MNIRIQHDQQAPTASLELAILHPLPDYDLEEVEHPTPRDVDPVLASQGFSDLLDEARAVVERETTDGSLEIEQLTGAICHEGEVHRPGLWLVVRERGAADHGPMSEQAQAKVAVLAGKLRETLGIG